MGKLNCILFKILKAYAKIFLLISGTWLVNLAANPILMRSNPSLPMSKQIKSLRRNLLIVCEGEVTEPDYFSRLRRIALGQKNWAEIEIRPKPKSDPIEEIATVSKHKTPRQKRTFKTVSIIEELDEAESKYDIKSEPTKWVKEARDGLKEDTFSEVWAVFDHDNRTKHEEAFQLAQEKINGNRVQIAFSSIAIEHWFLLHFERNNYTFSKSKCRSGKEPIECGTKTHSDDCEGKLCLIGYLRYQNYLPFSESTKKSLAESDFLKTITETSIRNIAYENAAWLRFKTPHDPLRPFLSNPFTNVDELVQRLLGEEQAITWGTFNQQIDWQNLRIKALLTGEKVNIVIQNTSYQTRLINGVDIDILAKTHDKTLKSVVLNTLILRHNEAQNIVVELEQMDELMIQVKTNASKLMIG